MTAAKRLETQSTDLMNLLRKLPDSFSQMGSGVSDDDKRAAELERRAFDLLTDEQKYELYKQAAMESARLGAADAVRDALADADVTLRDITTRVGMAPSRISEIATASGEQGPKLWSLFLIASALGKRLRITFE